MKKKASLQSPYFINTMKKWEKREVIKKIIKTRNN